MKKRVPWFSVNIDNDEELLIDICLKHESIFLLSMHFKESS